MDEDGDTARLRELLRDESVVREVLRLFHRDPSEFAIGAEHAARSLALAMALQPRLGAESPLARLPAVLLQRIANIVKVQHARWMKAIAVRADAHLLPVLIGCTPMTLTKGEPWYHIPESKPFFELRILDLTGADDLVGDGLERRQKEKALNRALEGFFRHHVGA